MGEMDEDEQAHTAAMKRLEPLVGEWEVEAVFPSRPNEVVSGGRSVFEWMRGGQLLIERSEAPDPFPQSISIIAFDPDKDAYTQHYFDSRGVIRLYAMSFNDGVWTLLRTSPDFSPLDFSQRFRGTLHDNGDTIRGAWETSDDGSHWKLDFDLTYRRAKVKS